MQPVNDFNDLQNFAGEEAIRDIFKRALDSAKLKDAENNKMHPTSLISRPKLVTTTDEPPAPPIMDPKGFHGLLGKIAAAACENSEADPVAVCSYVLSRLGATIGRKVFQGIGDGELNARPFILVVGRSGKARKGTSEAFPNKLFNHTELTKITNLERLKVHSGGLSSGEGVGYALRDASEKLDADNIPVDKGVSDKRMLVIESEFVNVLSICKREGNTLSATIRNLWDGKDIEPLTKNNRWKASNPHCTIVAHITGHELIERLSSNDMANGFLNRFIVVYVSRKKLVPNPLRTDPALVESLSHELAKVLNFIDAHSNDTESFEIKFEASAMDFWVSIYPDVSKERLGIEGMLLARSETYARMLAMIFALLDRSEVIKTEHLMAALAWVDFWIDSIRFIFRNQKQVIEHAKSTEHAEQILNLIFSSIKGLSRAEISDAFNRHLTKKQLDDAIQILLSATPPSILAHAVKTDGANKTIYSAVRN